MSVVVYNGITTPYPMTSNFKMVAVYDQSNTDRIYTQYDITTEFVLNVTYLRVIDPTLAQGIPDADIPDNAAMIAAAIRNKLLQHRKTLSFQCNGQELIPRTQAGISGTVDAKNGPIPQSCTLTQLTTVTFLMRFHIIAHYWENPEFEMDGTIAENKQTGTVLTCRWSESVDMDECLVSTRTRQGYYIIRSDNAKGDTLDDVREIIAPLAVPSGFMRKKSSYQVDPDGLKLTFTVVDVEYFRVPPPPAYAAKGEFIETTTYRGAVRFGLCKITLRGTQDTTLTHPSELLKAAMILASRKVEINGAEVGLVNGRVGLSLLEYCVISVDLFTNAVSVDLKVRLNGRRARFRGIPVRQLGSYVFVPGIDAPSQIPPPSYPLRGTAGLILHAAKYFDPNLRDHPLLNTETRGIPELPNGFQFQDGREPGQAGLQPE